MSTDPNSKDYCLMCHTIEINKQYTKERLYDDIEECPQCGADWKGLGLAPVKIVTREELEKLYEQ